MFEDENEAARYCDLLQGGGQGCEGVAEIEASSVRDGANLLEKRIHSLVLLVITFIFFLLFYFLFSGF